MNRYAIVNAKLILSERIIPKGTVVVKGKKIVAIKKNGRIPRGAGKINARGNFVSPGFIDLHIHGDVKQVSRQQIKGGTCAFLATLHPAGPKALLKNITQARTQSSKVCGAKVLGLRLEGPFLNRVFSGALSKKALRQPNISEAKRIVKQAGGVLRIVVLAPELKGAIKLIRLLKRRKIIASLGHTAATYAQAKTGIEAGLKHVTHMFNRIREFSHRDPGALTAALTDGRLSCEVIADGIHVKPAALRLLAACKGLDRIMLVTDSTAAQKFPPKKRCADVFRLIDGTLYGTALTLNKALKNMVKFLRLSLPEAVKLVTLNPAKLLKIDRRKGSLAVGKDADIVIFDKNFDVKLTMVEGNVRYNRLYR